MLSTATRGARVTTWFVIGMLILICVGAVYELAAHPPDQLHVSVEPVHATTTIVRKFPDARIIAGTVLEIPVTDARLRFVAPGSGFEFIPVITIVLLLLVGLYFFYDFSITSPFTRKALNGLWFLQGLLLIGNVALIIQHQWFRAVVLHLTAGEFEYTGTSQRALGSMLLIMLLARAIAIFTRGVKMQEESSLII